MRTVEELREIIVKHRPYPYEDFGEILCYYIHEYSMTFKELAKYFGFSLDELAEVIADHIRRL